MRSQRGVYLVLVSFVLVMLVGLSALVVDVGKLILLRNEMQKAVDAPAIAAAAELNNKSDSISRAENHARLMLLHKSKLAKKANLIGDASIPSDLVTFEYFCSIGNAFDAVEECDNYDGSSSPPLLISANVSNGGIDANYVRVTFNPSFTSAEYYSTDFIFLPAFLSLIGIQASDINVDKDLSTSALAGRSEFTCNFPPVMFCNPYEENSLNLSPGDFFALKDKLQKVKDADSTDPVVGADTKQKVPGEFAWLCVNGGCSPQDIGDAIANPLTVGCNPALVDNSTGNMIPVLNGVNVRHDIFEKKYSGKDGDYADPASTDNYGLPQNLIDDDTIIIGGNDCVDSGAGEVCPTIGETRWEHYIRVNSFSGDPEDDPRLLYAAVPNCLAQEVKGKSTDIALPEPGFAKIFLTNCVNVSGSSSCPVVPGQQQNVVYAEFVEWASETDADYHVDIQLYE
jgi:Putative Flp pilus-assembly TadE/G-like